MISTQFAVYVGKNLGAPSAIGLRRRLEQRQGPTAIALGAMQARQQDNHFKTLWHYGMRLRQRVACRCQITIGPENISAACSNKPCFTVGSVSNDAWISNKSASLR